MMQVDSTGRHTGSNSGGGQPHGTGAMMSGDSSNRNAHPSSWDAYEDPQYGFVYFYNRQSRQVRWTVPEDHCFPQAAPSDAHRRVAAFLQTDNDGDHVFYHDRQTDQVHWSLPAGALKPIPIPLAAEPEVVWDCYLSANGQRFFHHRLTDQSVSVPPRPGRGVPLEWHVRGQASYNDGADFGMGERYNDDDDDGHGDANEKQGAEFVDSSGLEFVIPGEEEEGDDDEYYEEGDDYYYENNEEETANALQAQEAKAAAAAAVAEQKALEAQLQREIQATQDEFIGMLQERGVQSFSQWNAWIPKLNSDDRFHAVEDLEERRELFLAHVRKLIQAKQGSGRQHVLDTASVALKALLVSPEGAAMVKVCAGKAKSFLKRLGALTGLVAESARVALAELSADDRKKLVRSLLASA